MWWLLPFACSGPDPGPADRPLTLARYAEVCEQALGPIPDLHCDDGVVVPIDVTGPDGVTRTADTVADLEDGVACDRPSPISGCVPGSRAGSVRTADATWHFVCRVNHADTPPGLYDDIALIGHDPESGAACFFGAAADGTRRDGTMPHPARGDGYWATKPDQADHECRTCHDADPVVVTPWIEAAGVIDHDPLAPFVLLGEAELEALRPGAWRPGARLVHADAGPCTACHDLTDRAFSCATAATATGTEAWRASEAATRWPLSHWMADFDLAARLEDTPTEADWDAAYGLARDTVLGCCSGALSPEDCYAP